jgi:hypothetical protein
VPQWAVTLGVGRIGFGDAALQCAASVVMGVSFMRRWVIAVSCVMLALFASTVVCAQALVIVDSAKLDRYWRISGPMMLTMEVGNVHEQAYGCITIGFMIDREGKITAVRTLRRAFGAKVPLRTARELTVGVTNGASMLAQYMPTPDNSKRKEVFTALAIPVIGRKHSKSLSLAQREAIAARLRPSCEIADLAAWIDSRDMRKEPPVETAPEIDFAEISETL